MASQKILSFPIQVCLLSRVLLIVNCVCVSIKRQDTRQIYYSIPFLALKMPAAVHTGPELETKTNCQKRAELSDQAEVLAESGWRLKAGRVWALGRDFFVL